MKSIFLISALILGTAAPVAAGNAGNANIIAPNNFTSTFGNVGIIAPNNFTGTFGNAGIIAPNNFTTTPRRIGGSSSIKLTPFILRGRTR